MTNSVRELVEAAKELLSKRGSSFDIVGHDHVGHPLNAEGMAAMKTRAAIAAVEAEGDGWIEIKEGCEMPPVEIMVSVYYSGRVTCGWRRDLRYYKRKAAAWYVGNNATDAVTHWQPLPSAPTVSGKEPK